MLLKLYYTQPDSLEDFKFWKEQKHIHLEP